MAKRAKLDYDSQNSLIELLVEIPRRHDDSILKMA